MYRKMKMHGYKLIEIVTEWLTVVFARVIIRNWKRSDERRRWDFPRDNNFPVSGVSQRKTPSTVIIRPDSTDWSFSLHKHPSPGHLSLRDLRSLVGSPSEAVCLFVILSRSVPLSPSSHIWLQRTWYSVRINTVYKLSSPHILQPGSPKSGLLELVRMIQELFSVK